MSVEWLSSVYDWKAGIALIVMVVALGKFGRWLVFKVPAFQGVREQNRALDKERLGRDKYPPMIKRSIRAGMWTNLAFFFVMAPLVVSFEPRPLWRGLFDIVLILMVYDFFYYLTHRFLFHDGPLGGPLIWVHAVHHQQRNPCRADSSYLHPLEPVLGLALYAATIAVLAALMGRFHVATIVITWVAFSEINLHNPAASG